MNFLIKLIWNDTKSMYGGKTDRYGGWNWNDKADG